MYVHPSRAHKTSLDGSKSQKKEEIDELTGPSNTSYIVGFVIGGLLLAWTAVMAHSHQLNGWQARIFYDFDNINLSSAAVTIAKWLTEGLGAAYPIAACALIAALYNRYRLAWRFLFTAGGATAVFYVIKKIINEPRPIAMLNGHLHQRVVETGPGFPSGHETAATALALTLWLILPKQWRWLSIIWVTVVAFTRLALGVHTPGDVIGGFAVGLMSVCFVQLLPDNLANRIYLYKGSGLLKQGK